MKWLLVLAACGGGDAAQSGSVRMTKSSITVSFTEHGSDCPAEPFDSCVVFSPCTAKATEVSAGDVTIGAAPPLEFLDGGYGTLGIADGTFFSDGETVAVSATGDVVPAFAGSIIAPRATTILAPVINHPIARDRDLEVNWQDIGANLVAGEIQAQGYAMQCVFQGSAMTGTIPRAALAMMPAGEGFVQFGNANTVEIQDGEWAITLVANVTTISNPTTLQ